MESSINADELSYFQSLLDFGSFPPKSSFIRGAIEGLDIGLMEIHFPAFLVRETLKQTSARCEAGTFGSTLPNWDSMCELIRLESLHMLDSVLGISTTSTVVAFLDSARKDGRQVEVKEGHGVMASKSFRRHLFKRPCVPTVPSLTS